MGSRSRFKQLLVVSTIVGCGTGFSACAPCAYSQAAPSAKAAAGLDWDQTFVDRSGARPLHFFAEYTDAHGAHRLEEWRTGLTHLRRRTDDRIDLHADATGKPAKNQGIDYLWQVIDVQRKIDNTISSGGMFRAGMFYSYYSMAHVLTRPAGRFRLEAIPEDKPVQLGGHTCAWFKLTPDGQPATEICWSSELGIPLEMRAAAAVAGVATFRVQALDQQMISAAVFAVKAAGLTVRNHDEMAEDD